MLSEIDFIKPIVRRLHDKAYASINEGFKM